MRVPLAAGSGPVRAPQAGRRTTRRDGGLGQCQSSKTNRIEDERPAQAVGCIVASLWARSARAPGSWTFSTAGSACSRRRGLPRRAKFISPSMSRASENRSSKRRLGTCVDRRCMVGRARSGQLVSCSKKRTTPFSASCSQRALQPINQECRRPRPPQHPP